MKYIKKPIPVEAIQWNGNNFEEIDALMQKGARRAIITAQNDLVIPTLEGDMKAPVGSYIIRGITGSDFYPCAKDVFERSYEPAEDSAVYNFKCEKCGTLVSRTHPDTMYDAINKNYKYWTICPNCRARIEGELNT